MAKIRNSVTIHFESGAKSVRNEDRTIPQIKEFYKIGSRSGYFVGNELKSGIISSLIITSKT